MNKLEEMSEELKELEDQSAILRNKIYVLTVSVMNYCGKIAKRIWEDVLIFIQIK